MPDQRSRNRKSPDYLQLSESELKLNIFSWLLAEMKIHVNKQSVELQLIIVSFVNTRSLWVVLSFISAKSQENMLSFNSTQTQTIVNNQVKWFLNSKNYQFMTQEANKQYFLAVPEKSVKLNHFQISNLKFWVDRIKKSIEIHE